MGKSSKPTIGYRHFMYLYMGESIGPNDYLAGIKVGAHKDLDRFVDEVIAKIPAVIDDAYADLAGALAFYATTLDCFVDGERVVNSLQIGEYKLTNKKYELTYGVNRDWLDDENSGALAGALMKIRSGGSKFRQHPDALVASVFAANPVSADGVALFSASHKTNPLDSASASWSNLKSSRDLVADNLAKARAEMMLYRDASGDYMAANATLLIVPPSLEYTARKLTQAEMVPAASGTASETNILRGTFEILVVPQLEAQSSTTWYLADVSDPNDRPFIFQTRAPLEIVAKFSPEDDNVFEREEYIWGARCRYVAGAGNPYKIAKYTA